MLGATDYAGLSERTRYLRHHGPRPRRLTRAEIAYLTDIDQHDRAAWVLLDHGGGIGLGRYVRPGLNDVAEVALTVVDAWQVRGLSKLLLAALMRTARAAGIARLGGVIMGEHGAVWHLVRGLDAQIRETHDGACWIEVRTDPALLPATPAAEALRYYDRLIGGDAGDVDRR